MTLIPLDEIHEPPELVRRRAPTPEQDAAMIASIQAQGQLTPVLVRQNGNGVVLVAGSRRIRALRALGRDTVEAHVLTIRPDQALAASAAENMVRADLAPVEQWRVIADLLREGYTLNHAAGCLGMTERQAKRLAKLADLHPDMLALIEKFGMPDAEELAVIAAAPRDVQAKAVAKHVSSADEKDGADWWHITHACDITRISRAVAIFDVDVETVVFEEDLFAQPGDPDAFTTTDVKGFLAAQERALRERIATDQAAKKRVQLAGYRNGHTRLPSGWHETYGSIDKPKKTETVFLTVIDAGYRLGRIVGATAVKDKAQPKDADVPGDDAEDDAADTTETTAQARPAGQSSAPEPADTEPRDPINLAGRAAIAEAKTRALREHLTSGAAPSSAQQLLAFLVLALGGRTVRVSDVTGYRQIDMRDLAARLVSPDGTNLHFDDLFPTAFEALSRLMHVPGPKDGMDPAVEWIGHFTRAADALPRFDTPEFLAHVAGAELKRLAAEIGMRPAKTVAGLREQLAGNLPDWRPATFGAPGPKGESES